MTKNATKRKDNTRANIKRRLSVAICMLLVSTIMLVTSTYAWFTLSTSPEVKSINTSVTGNGSLEIALMPTTGLFSDITSGRGASGTEYGGSREMTAANVTWGNVVNLKDQSYGLQLVTLRPVQFNIDTHEEQIAVPKLDDQGNEMKDPETNETIMESKTVIVPDGTIQAIPFSRPAYGYDGRITELKGMSLKSKDTSAVFDSDNYGVRAIVDDAGSAYGYVIDLAFRLNTKADDGVTAGKLLLQTTGIQRVYSDSTATATQGGGSNLWFQDNDGNDVAGADQALATKYLESIRIAFVQNLGNADQAGLARVLTYARADVNTGDLYLCDYFGERLTGDSEKVILTSMTKNQAYQISVVVWLDGNVVTNANMAINNDVLSKATLNLQFATDVTLHPAQNSDLHDNPPSPPEPETPATPATTVTTLQNAMTNYSSLYNQAKAAETAAAEADPPEELAEAVAAFISQYETIQTGLGNNEYDETSSDDLDTLINALVEKAEDADAVLNPANP